MDTEHVHKQCNNQTTLNVSNTIIKILNVCNQYNNKINDTQQCYTSEHACTQQRCPWRAERQINTPPDAGYFPGSCLIRRNT